MTPGNDGPVHILVVNRDTDERRPLAAALRAAGYVVSETDDAREAGTIITNDKPRAAVLDLNTPGLTPGAMGRTLADELASEHDLPLILLSDRSSDYALAHLVGALAFFVKPVTPQQIVPSIRIALAHAERTEGLANSAQELERALNDARAINVAIGILMERRGYDRNEAFETLRAQARAERRRLHDYASDIVDTVEKLNKSGGMR